MNLKQAIQILELKSLENTSDLKKVFWSLAHRYHPDKNQNPLASARFRDILEAYQWCLDHLDLVCAHFAILPIPNEARGAKPEEADAHNLDDVFAEIFGYGKDLDELGWQRAEPLKITVEELARGGIKEARLCGSVKCSDCQGLGAAFGTPAHVCRYCFGRGFVPRRISLKRQKVLWGKDVVWSGKYRLCRRCGGRGRDLEEHCPSCDGFGRRSRHHRHRIVLPVGLMPGQVCRMPGMDLVTGDMSKVVFEVRVLPHSIFEIEKHDLMCDYIVLENQFSGQKRVDLKTPFGKAAFDLPDNVIDAQVIRITGAGLYHDAGKSSRGDLVVRIRLKPARLWDRFKRIFTDKSG